MKKLFGIILFYRRLFAALKILINSFLSNFKTFRSRMNLTNDYNESSINLIFS